MIRGMVAEALASELRRPVRRHELRREAARASSRSPRGRRAELLACARDIRVGAVLAFRSGRYGLERYREVLACARRAVALCAASRLSREEVR